MVECVGWCLELGTNRTSVWASFHSESRKVPAENDKKTLVFNGIKLIEKIASCKIILQSYGVFGRQFRFSSSIELWFFIENVISPRQFPLWNAHYLCKFLIVWAHSSQMHLRNFSPQKINFCYKRILTWKHFNIIR